MKWQQLVVCVGLSSLAGCFGKSGNNNDDGGAVFDAPFDGFSSSGDDASPRNDASSPGEASAPEASAGDSGTGDSGTGDSGTGGTVAMSFGALPSGAFAYTQGSYIEGFQFKAAVSLRVTQLGYYDSNLTGTAQSFTALEVGLYDMTTSTLLGSTTVQPGDPAMGIFRFHPLATVIPLNTTDTYACVAVTGSNHYVSGYNYAAGQIDSSLTWVGFAGYGNNNLTMTTTLVQPNFFWTTTGNLGANFAFEM
jgi:hypothetical protein